MPQFQKIQPLPILSCGTCHSVGSIGFRNCPACRGLAMGIGIRNKWMYWNYPLERYHLTLQRFRRIFNKIRFITSLLIGVNFLIWGILFAFRTNFFQLLLSNPLTFPNIGARAEGQIGFFLLLSLLFFTYAFYRSVKERPHFKGVENFDYSGKEEAENITVGSWAEVRSISRKRKLNVSEAYTEEALEALGKAFEFSAKRGIRTVGAREIFFVLLNFNRIANIFIRLGLSTKTIEKEVNKLYVEKSGVKSASTLNSDRGVSPLGSARGVSPEITDELKQIIFKAYQIAYSEHQDYVSVTELLSASVAESPQLQEILFDLAIDKQKLYNVVAWARIREKLFRQYKKFRHAAGRRSTKGMDRAMTAVQTPYLNRFSDDLTILAQFGHTDACVARDKEMNEIFRIIDGGKESVLLVGDYGVGKKSIVEGIAQRMVEDDVPGRLKDKRLVRLSVSSLLSGATPTEAVERLLKIIYEIERAGNIALFIHNIHELIGVSAGGEESLDVAGTLADRLSGAPFMTIATTTSESFAHSIANSKLSAIFTKVEVKEMDENQAIQVLESKVGGVEYKQKVFFSYNAIEKAVKLCKQYVHETSLPGSALEVMIESASLARSAKGSNSLVTAEEAAKIVSEKTKIPVTTVSADETEKLLNLEDEMHKRVVGQVEAVELVASALRRSRAEMRSQARPIANFLFLGPTGVGKTELAKTIADVYFGGEERMIRIDMSEYQDKISMNRMIGLAGEKGSGVLTEAVRRNPFSLLLLDEIEKADKDVLNLFLQVMDDGRLTDSTGRVVDFTNVILIATSNAGTSFVSEQLKNGLSTVQIKDQLLHGELAQYFRPEFLNRFDGIVLFKPLSLIDIKHIAGLMLKRVANDLDKKGIQLEVTDDALSYLAGVGFDPDFGARPMRRVIEDKVENKLAELLLSGQIKRRDTVVIGEGGELSLK